MMMWRTSSVNNKLLHEYDVAANGPTRSAERPLRAALGQHVMIARSMDSQWHESSCSSCNQPQLMKSVERCCLLLDP
jgi:hypothetical protein